MAPPKYAEKDIPTSGLYEKLGLEFGASSKEIKKGYKVGNNARGHFCRRCQSQYSLNYFLGDGSKTSPG